jgi:flavin reductase (DIM6/NTAB) family NADH-FMN oxidoreductase RutF
VGLAVGSFSSLSLEPPLVSFMADHRSSSWPVLRVGGVFCANILTSEQLAVCAALARKGPEKFAGLAWQAGPLTGAPMLENSAAWIECRIDAVHTAGDHDIVIGEVLALDLGRPEHHHDPLVFFRGGYARLVPLEVHQA